MKKQIMACVTTVALFSGCATITQSSNQSVTFNSVPSGAKVYVDGQIKGTTPMSVQLEKGESNSVKFMKEGYESIEKPIETEIDGWFWANILVGGVVGSTTDAISGNMYEYAPNSYTVELKKK